MRDMILSGIGGMLAWLVWCIIDKHGLETRVFGYIAMFIFLLLCGLLFIWFTFKEGK